MSDALTPISDVFSVATRVADRADIDVSLWDRANGEASRGHTASVAEWSQKHPEVQRIPAGTVNKLLGAVQAISVWERDNGLVPEDSSWADAFSRMRLEEQEPEREPREIADLKKLFASEIYAALIDHRLDVIAMGLGQAGDRVEITLRRNGFH